MSILISALRLNIRPLVPLPKRFFFRFVPVARVLAALTSVAIYAFPFAVDVRKELRGPFAKRAWADLFHLFSWAARVLAYRHIRRNPQSFGQRVFAGLKKLTVARYAETAVSINNHASPPFTHLEEGMDTPSRSRRKLFRCFW